MALPSLLKEQWHELIKWHKQQALSQTQGMHIRLCCVGQANKHESLSFCRKLLG
jgi:hypothetical protein